MSATNSKSTSAPAKPELTDEEKHVRNVANNITAFSILTGTMVTQEIFRTVSYRFTPTSVDTGPKILTKESHAITERINTLETTSPVIREGNMMILATHAQNLRKTVSLHEAALAAVLAAVIGKKDETSLIIDAYRELGVLNERLLNRETIPSLERKEEEKRKMVTGLAPDVAAAIKDVPEFANLQAIADEREVRAHDRLKSLKSEFEARFPKELRQRIEMLDLVESYQNDPKKTTYAEKENLVLSKNGGRIFDTKNQLTELAKARLNEIQNEPNTPDYINSRIRRIFGKNKTAIEKNNVKTQIGDGL